MRNDTARFFLMHWGRGREEETDWKRMQKGTKREREAREEGDDNG